MSARSAEQIQADTLRRLNRDVAEYAADAAAERLMAAAPDLLAALVDALGLIETYKTARHTSIAARARAAIAKAHGRERPR